MIRGVLESINGIAILPIIGLILFFAVFISMIIHALRLKKAHLDHMGQLPLERDASSSDHDASLPSSGAHP
jgi:cytochrome c oxidase cbb3-type subunit IV